MESQRKVLFYGDSVLLAGLYARLQSNPGANVARLENEPLPIAGPCVVVYDLGAPDPGDLLAQVEALPEMLLIGIDPENHALLLGGQAAGNISLEQITQIIQSPDPS